MAINTSGSLGALSVGREISNSAVRAQDARAAPGVCACSCVRVCVPVCTRASESVCVHLGLWVSSQHDVGVGVGECVWSCKVVAHTYTPKRANQHTHTLPPADIRSAFTHMCANCEISVLPAVRPCVCVNVMLIN